MVELFYGFEYLFLTFFFALIFLFSIIALKGVKDRFQRVLLRTVMICSLFAVGTFLLQFLIQTRSFPEDQLRAISSSAETALLGFFSLFYLACAVELGYYFCKEAWNSFDSLLSSIFCFLYLVSSIALGGSFFTLITT